MPTEKKRRTGAAGAARSPDEAAPNRGGRPAGERRGARAASGAAVPAEDGAIPAERGALPAEGGALPADLDPELREALEALGAMQQSLLTQVAEVQQAHQRIQADALSRLEPRLGRDDPRLESLRAATEQSQALSEALLRATGAEKGPRRQSRTRRASKSSGSGASTARAKSPRARKRPSS